MEKSARLFEEGEKEFDIVEMYVDRKWYQVDVHILNGNGSDNGSGNHGNGSSSGCGSSSG